MCKWGKGEAASGWRQCMASPHLAVFSGRYFIRNVPWVVQTQQTPTWCLSSSHAPQAGGFFYYAPPRVTPLLETG